MCPPTELDALSNTISTPNPKKYELPPGPLAGAAFKHAYQHLAPAVLDHSFRVYLYASALAKETNCEYFSNELKHGLLFTACLFHDIGTADKYNGPERFEIAGADAAVTFLSPFKEIFEEERHDVWTAIACHTSPQIAERIGELSKLVRIAVIHDFGRKSEAWDVLEPLRAGFEETYGRARIEKVLGDAVIEQAKKKPEKAPMVSWPGVMYRSHLEDPEWDGINKAF